VRTAFSCLAWGLVVMAVAAGHPVLAAPTTFAVHPAHVVVQAGRSVRFTAVAQGSPSDAFTPAKLSWQADGGTIDGMGTFVAGALPGDYPVRATAGPISAAATVRVVAMAPAADDILPGWIFVRRWHLLPNEDDTLEVTLKAVVNGQTITRAAMFAVTDDGREVMLQSMPAHHRKRCHFSARFRHGGFTYIDVRAYDHDDEVVARVRRLF